MEKEGLDANGISNLLNKKSGAPGQAAEFYIRGIGTFGGRATPLIMLADSTQLNQLTHQLMDRRNQVLKEYLLRQEVPEKCIRISTATAEKLVAYKGKNQYTIGLVFAGDEPDPELIAEETEN